MSTIQFNVTTFFQAHLEDKDKKFIHDIKAYPDPAVVLASDQHLCDLEEFCYNLSDFCVLTAHQTFSLKDLMLLLQPITISCCEGRGITSHCDVGSNHSSLQGEFSNVFVSSICNNQLVQIGRSVYVLHLLMNCQ